MNCSDGTALSPFPVDSAARFNHTLFDSVVDVSTNGFTGIQVRTSHVLECVGEVRPMQDRHTQTGIAIAASLCAMSHSNACASTGLGKAETTYNSCNELCAPFCGTPAERACLAIVSVCAAWRSIQIQSDSASNVAGGLSQCCSRCRRVPVICHCHAHILRFSCS